MFKIFEQKGRGGCPPDGRTAEGGQRDGYTLLLFSRAVSCESFILHTVSHRTVTLHGYQRIFWRRRQRQEGELPGSDGDLATCSCAYLFIQKAPSPAKPVNKRPIESEGDLIDSDEDEDCQQSSNRRRLQKKSEAKKRPIPAPDVVDISSPRQSPAAKKKPRVEDEATLLIPPVALTKPKPAVELKKLNSVQNASYQKKEVGPIDLN